LEAAGTDMNEGKGAEMEEDDDGCGTSGARVSSEKAPPRRLGATIVLTTRSLSSALARKPCEWPEEGTGTDAGSGAAGESTKSGCLHIGHAFSSSSHWVIQAR